MVLFNISTIILKQNQCVAGLFLYKTSLVKSYV